MTILRVGKNVELPVELAVEKLAILAQSGAGKSNAAVVLAEELHAAGVPWVAVDPKGDWFGIRAAGDGKRPGLPIPVLGGLHGDVPLEPTAGKLVANLIVDKRLTCVLDVSEFDVRQDMFRFLADFADTLLKRNRLPLHVFAEEADDYVPQSAREKGNQARCLGAWQRLVKRGRFRGVGCTLISQRSAALNKDALAQTDTLIVMRTTLPNDHKAIAPWITEHGLDAKALIETLPSLADGEAWVWSPHKLHMNERVKFRRRHTFDSGATPFSLDDASQNVATLADVDLDALKEQMAETVARAERDDPAKLRAEIAKLKTELTKRPTEKVIETITEVVEVPVLTDDEATMLFGLIDTMREVASQSKRLHESITARLGEPPPSPETACTLETASREVARPGPLARERMKASSGIVRPVDESGLPLGKTPRKVLSVLVQHPKGLSKARLAALSGLSTRKSTIRNALSDLRKPGFVESDGDLIRASAAGIAHIGDDVDELPSGEELVDYWLNKVGRDSANGRVLRVLIEAWPNELDKQTVCSRALINDPELSTVRNAASRLRTYGLLGNGWILREEIAEAMGL